MDPYRPSDYDALDYMLGPYVSEAGPMGPEGVVAYARMRCSQLGISLPQWAEKALREHPKNAGVIGDAIAVQSGLIAPPMDFSPPPRRWWQFWRWGE
jgi:hypothetical protein